MPNLKSEQSEILLKLLVAQLLLLLHYLQVRGQGFYLQCICSKVMKINKKKSVMFIPTFFTQDNTHKQLHTKNKKQLKRNQ